MVPVEVRGVPSSTAVEDWVERHENVHVGHLRDLVLEDVLLPWDQMIENFRAAQHPVEGATPAAAEQNFYRLVGGTPQEIADRLVGEFNQKSHAFHHSDVGREPPPSEVQLEKPFFGEAKLVVLLDASTGGPP